MYKEEDVISYLKTIVPVMKTRKRSYLDPRDYLLALLFYKFKNTEAEIGRLYGIDRTTVNHAKRNPYYHMASKNTTFLTNTEEARRLFPFKFPNPDKYRSQAKKNKLIIPVTTAMKNKLIAIAKRDNIKVSDVVKGFIKNALDEKRISK